MKEMNYYTTVQAGLPAVHAGAPHPPRDWQGQEPMAQCRCPLWCFVAVFRHEGDELLHRAVRRIACSRRDCQLSVGPRPRAAPGEAQVYVHCWTQEAGWSLTLHDQLTFPGTLGWLIGHVELSSNQLLES